MGKVERECGEEGIEDRKGRRKMRNNVKTEYREEVRRIEEHGIGRKKGGEEGGWKEELRSKRRKATRKRQRLSREE